MLRIVLPAGVPITDVVAVAAVNIRVPNEIIIVVDVDVVVAAPPASPAPTAAPSRSNSQSDSKRDRHSRRVIACRRIVDGWIGIDRWAIDHDRIIGRYVYDLRIGLFNDYYTFIVDSFDFHLLLLSRFQIPSVLGLFAHTLHGVHHIVFLGKERIAQIRGPLNVVGQPLYQIGERRHGLDTRIPGLLRDSIGKRLVLQP